MPFIKKTIIALVSIVVLVIALNYGVSYYITKKLPTIINNQENFPYQISYHDLDISLINGNITIYKAALAPKDSTEVKLNQGAYATIKQIDVKNFNLWALLKNDRIKVRKVTLDTPEIILYEKKKKYNAEDDFVKPFKNTITTQSFEIINGNFKMLDSKLKFLLKASDIDFTVNDIKVDSASINDNIPVRYSSYNLKCDSLFYRVNNFYNITATKVNTKDSILTIDNFKLIPQHSRENFVKVIDKEKDQFAVTVQNITIPKADWGFVNDIFYFHSPSVILNRVNANIYRNKLPKDDLSVKKLYSQVLREIKFDLKVDKLMLKNSVLEYEEQTNWQRPPGKLSFSQFYATISNVYSPVNKGKLPNTIIDVQCLLMKTAPLKVKWWFNSLDKSDSFTMQGHLQDIASNNLNRLTKPLMNVTTTGVLKDVKFTINGNREKATGKFAINYDNLKIEAFKDNGKKKDKLVTAIGNLIVKNDSQNELKETDFEVTRLKDKSVFNLMSRCMQEGLKKTIIPKAISALIPKKDNK